MYLKGLYVTKTTEFASLTFGLPKGGFEAGRQVDYVTEPETRRSASEFYGFQGIDQIAWMWDACHTVNSYVVGWHENDLSEYLMKFGGDYSRLILRGLGDFPGPVKVQIYVDGELKGAAEFTNDDNCLQDVSVDIPGIPFGAHAIAVKFVNPWRDPTYEPWTDGWDPNRERNMYLNQLRVVESPPMPPPIWTYACGENGVVVVSGLTEVRYGAEGGCGYRYATVNSNISCSNAYFGDPCVGTVKHCDTRP